MPQFSPISQILNMMQPACRPTIEENKYQFRAV